MLALLRDASMAPKLVSLRLKDATQPVLVIYERIGTDRVVIGDPSVGREDWTLADLRQLWNGNGI